MPRTNSLHKASSGKLAGQWVGCPAQVACRNGGVHISRDDMRDLKNALKEHTGRFIPMGEITADDAKKYLDALEETPKTVEEEKNPIKDYKDNFSADVVKKNISDINFITKGRARSLDSARTQIVEQYEEVANALPTDTVLSNLYRNVAGATTTEVYSLKVTDGQLVATDSIEVEEDEYDAKVQEILASAKTPDSYSAPSWEDAEYLDDDPYDYYDDYETYVKQITITRNFKLTAEQEQQYLDAKKKSDLSKLYPIASDKAFPSWALTGHVYGQSGQIKNEIDRITRTTNRDLTEAQRKYDVAHAKVAVAQRRQADVTALTRKIDEATRLRDATNNPVSVDALNRYIKAETTKKVNAERAYNTAARASTPEKLESLRQNIEVAYRAQQDAAVNAAGDLRKKYAIEWLTERFPARNGNVRRASARAWVREHPEVVEKINNLPK